jgi:hypothetical protein
MDGADADSEPVAPRRTSIFEQQPDVVFRTGDHPAANGREPQVGEVGWTFAFKLEDGAVLHVLAGEEGRRTLASMIFAHLTDDARDDAIGRAKRLIEDQGSNS